MRFALMLEPQQGLSYDHQSQIAQRAEALGFEALFRSDHYQSFPGPAGLPTTDAWAVLAGLARDTRTIHLGALVSPVTFRLPGNLAKIAMTVHEMSGGRVELGLGAGWNDDEHRQYGFPFPPIETRAEMLEEQLAIVAGLWDEPNGWTFAGRHYQIEGALFAPKPEPGARPRIIVGGEGTRRSMRIAARFADEFNITSATPDTARERYGWLDEACLAIGRDPATVTRTAMIGVMIGEDAAALDRRANAMLDRIGGGGGATGGGAATASAGAASAWLDARRPRWVMGTYEEARAAVRRFEAAGVQRIMLQDMLPWDMEMIEEIGHEIVGRV